MKQSIKETEEVCGNIVEYDSAKIDIGDARFLAETAEKQLNSPHKPIKTEECGREVLIIEENADEVHS